jgi:pimeloyl-ACP methyl ester carboxylesterase
MNDAPPMSTRGRILRIVRYAFLTWAVVSTSWLANSFRTRGVDDAVLESSPWVAVRNGDGTLSFVPASGGRSALIFFCGSGVSAKAYAPMLRPIADAGYAVHVIPLPWRFAPLASHKEEAIARARQVVVRNPDVARWVVSGHSLGAALTARWAAETPTPMAAIVLLGTTHPKAHDLSALAIPVTKVYATNDGVAPARKVLGNRHLLPPHTKWVEIPGGNHSQFGHYGHQLFDGDATIAREEQQGMAREELIASLRAEG